MTPRNAKGEGTLFKVEGRGWRGYITIDGQRRYFSAATKAEAAAKRRELIHQAATGELSTGRAPTIQEWLEHWLTITEHSHKPSTHTTYQGYIANYITPELGKLRLDKLTLDRLEQFYAKLQAAGYSGSTRHQIHSILRVALKHAVWRGHIARNVAALIQAPSPSKRRTETLSDADREALYKALEGHRYEARWLLGLDLGLRPGEATAIEWRHVDFNAHTLTIEQQIIQVRGRGAILESSTKTGNGARTIVLPGYILEALQRTRQRQLEEMAMLGDEWKPWSPDGEAHSFVFTQLNGQPLRPGLDTTIWKKLLNDAGLPPTRRYTARHTAISALVANPAADIATVSEVAGHANPAFTLAVYTHAIDERKTALAASLERQRRTP